MRELLNKMGDFGVISTDAQSEQRATRLLNQITISLFIIEFFTYPEVIYNQSWEALTVIFITQLVTVIPLLLTYYHKNNLAKCYFNIVFATFMTGIIILYGWKLRIDFSYSIFIITGIIFFQKRWQQVSILIFLICCYLFAVYYTDNYLSIYEHRVSLWNRSVVFLAIIVCTVIIVRGFKRDVEKYEKSLKETFNELQDKKEKIESQNTNLEDANRNLEGANRNLEGANRNLEGANQDLEGANQDLEGANQDLERFAYIASHNLKTPVRTIRSFTDLIERDLKREKTENVYEYLDFIKIGTEQMQFLITNILEYSRINESFEMESTAVDLNKSIAFIYIQFQSIEKKVILINTDKLPTIYINRTFITAIFQNLIENAIKYNQSEKIIINIDFRETEVDYIFSFSDNGIGIDPTYHQKIFKMFERLESSSKYSGTGIGLAMIKKITNKLNGKVWLTSEVGVGSTFFVQLPKTT
jgi:signal transduction histidine kinase